MLKAVARRAEIIHQHDGINGQLARQRSRIHNPRKIRRMNAVADHRPGHTKSGRADFLVAKVWRSLAGEFLNDQIELREALAGKPLAKNHFQIAIFLRKKSQIAFCATNVACENHHASGQ